MRQSKGSFARAAGPTHLHQPQPARGKRRRPPISAMRTAGHCLCEALEQRQLLSGYDTGINQTINSVSHQTQPFKGGFYVGAGAVLDISVSVIPLNQFDATHPLSGSVSFEWSTGANSVSTLLNPGPQIAEVNLTPAIAKGTGEVTVPISYADAVAAGPPQNNTQQSYVLLASYGGDSHYNASVGVMAQFIFTSTSSTSKLAFVHGPGNVAVGTTIAPPVTVAIEDSSGNVDTSASDIVTLALANGSGGGKLDGTLSEPAINGIATFSDLQISQSGSYQLKATDSGDDTPATSDKFTIGGDQISVAITAKPSGKPGKVVSGDTIRYNLAITAKKPLQSDVITDVLPAGFTPTHISNNGVFSGNTITWNTTAKQLGFQVIVPDAKTLNGLSSVVTNVNCNATFTDSTSDTTSATNTVKLNSSYQITGTLHDVQFQFPNKLSLKTSGGLRGVTVDLIDDTGAIVDTTTTKADGSFTLGANTPNDYTVRFNATTDVYSSASNGISAQHIYASQAVTIPPSSTKPVDMGDLYLSTSLFKTAAKILNSLNNYTTSGFQGLSSFKIDLFQFNTTSAENALALLAGTAQTPSPLMNIASLKIGGPEDPWVGAMRMVGGLSDINQRFFDTFHIADTTGKALSAIASAQFSKQLGKTLAGLNKAHPNQPSWSVNSISAVQTKLNQAARVAGMTTLGAVLAPALNAAGVSGSAKSQILAVTFNVLRYASDIYTGKLIDDLGFEAVFNLIRLTADAAMLEVLTGVQVRPDVGAPYSQIGSAINFVNSLGATVNSMQGAIDALAHNNEQYNTGTDTAQVLSALDKFDGDEHTKAANEMGGTAVFSTIGSLLRGGDGVLALQSVAQKINPGQLSGFQGVMQQTLNKASSALTSVLGRSTKQLQLDALLLQFGSAAFGLTEQTAAASFIPNIAANAVLFGGSSVTSGALSASTTTPDAAPYVQISGAQPTAALAASNSTSDSAAYLADLAQLSTLVKSGNTSGIAALYPQFAADDQALFNNDLVVLDNQADAVAGTSSTADRKTIGRFDADLNVAVNASLLAELQLDTWGADTATGNAKDVLSQITKTTSAVTAAVKDASIVSGLLSGQTIPATLAIDQTSVPLQAGVGTMQSLVFTITNVGGQSSAAGTVTFSNSDGSLVLQGPAQQALAALAPGGSASFTWQVQTQTPSSANTGSVFQIDASAGSQTAELTGNILLGT